MRTLTQLVALLCLTLALIGCGQDSNTQTDAGQADADATDAGNLAVCNPVSPECGGQNWQFESAATCPSTLPVVTSTCEDFGTTCYYCDDPEAAASEPGHSFTVVACVANNETWQRQELTCATD